MKTRLSKMYMLVLLISSVISLIALIYIADLAIYSVSIPWIPFGAPLVAGYDFDFILYSIVAAFVLVGWTAVSLVLKCWSGKSQKIVLFSVMLLMETVLLAISIKLLPLRKLDIVYAWVPHFIEICKVSGVGLLVGGLWAFTNNRIRLNRSSVPSGDLRAND